MTQLQEPSAPTNTEVLSTDVIFLLLGIYGYIVLFIEENRQAHTPVKVGILPVAV